MNEPADGSFIGGRRLDDINRVNQTANLRLLDPYLSNSSRRGGGCATASFSTAKFHDTVVYSLIPEDLQGSG